MSAKYWPYVGTLVCALSASSAFAQPAPEPPPASAPDDAGSAVAPPGPGPTAPSAPPEPAPAPPAPEPPPSIVAPVVATPVQVRKVELHGFISEGAFVSSDNDYIGASSRGSLGMFEVGLNASTQVTRDLRAGIQLFARDIGLEEELQPRVDWAFLDYRWRRWLGLRAGVIKLPFGLYNEYVDIDAARVAILLPQSTYPIRNRDALIAHRGFSVYCEHSPGGYTMVSALVAELTLTFVFLIIILGATDKRAPAGFAPIPIGLGLTLIHLIGIPVTNLSVNPARSTGPAAFVGGWALSQLWLFWIAPIVGAAIAGVVYPAIAGRDEPRK